MSNDFAIKYEILRCVSPTGRKPCAVQPTAKPIRVAFLLNEQKLIETGGLIAHHDTVFLEDSTHDWDWRNGVFFYYGRAMGLEDVGDIVAIYEMGDSPRVESEEKGKEFDLQQVIATCREATHALTLDAPAAHALVGEIDRLKGIIARAKLESELIQHQGKPMLLVPYWFIKS